MTTVRHTPPAAVGFTQASRVTADVRRREAASATLTMLLVPLNDSALPNLPAVVQVALESVPVLLLPDASTVEVPVPSSKLYEATRPVAWPCATVLPRQAERVRTQRKKPGRRTRELP